VSKVYHSTSDASSQPQSLSLPALAEAPLESVV